MKVKSNKLGFLQESVLLEERGLPFMHNLIIITVAVLVIFFIIWSNFLTVDDTVSFSGVIVENAVGDLSFVGYAATADIPVVELGQEAYISIPGVTGRGSIVAIVKDFETEPLVSESGARAYPVYLDMMDQANYSIYEGMNVTVKVKTGSKTMLQFMLGALYDAAE